MLSSGPRAHVLSASRHHARLSTSATLPASSAARSGLQRSLDAVRVGNRLQRRIRATDKDGNPSSDGEASSSRRPEPAAEQPGPGKPYVDEQMETLWMDIKRSAKKELSEEEAMMLEKIKLEDLESGKWARKLASEQLGPTLASLGVEEEPLDFFLDVVKMLLFLQLITVGSLFYSAELLWHCNSGEAFRAASGLSLGYFLRPFFQVEQLLHPLYNWGLELFLPNAVYQISKPAPGEAQSTINRLSILIATAYFLPQAVLHWQAAECTQLVGPVAMGLFLFDVLFMVTLLLKFRML